MNRRDLLQGIAAGGVVAVLPAAAADGLPKGRVWAIYDNAECRDTIRRLRARGMFQPLPMIEHDLADVGFHLGDVREGDAFWLALERYDEEKHFAALLLRQFPGSELCRSGLSL